MPTLSRKSFAYDIDGGDFANSCRADSRFFYDKFVENIRKIGDRFYIWPGLEPDYPLIRRLMWDLSRSDEVWLVYRPFEYRPYALPLNAEMSLFYGEKRVVFDPRSHGYPPGQPLPPRVRELEDMIGAAQELAKVAFVTAVPTQGFMLENTEKYSLDGAQHIANTLGFNYFTPEFFDWFKIYVDDDVEIISGGLRWYDVTNRRLDRWLARCETDGARIIKYEAHEMLNGKVPELTQMCDTLLKRWRKILIYSGNVFAFDRQWMALFE